MLGWAYWHHFLEPVNDDPRPSKCLQQFGHRWSEVVTHADANGLRFFAARRQHISGFTIAAQFDEYLPKHMVGRQVSRGFRVSEEEMLRRLVLRLDASLLEQCLTEGEAT